MTRIILSLILFSLLHAFAFAAKQPYIVYMGAHSHHPKATTEDFHRVTDSHHQFLTSFLGSLEEAKSAIFYSYNKHINGFAANLDEHQAAEIAKHPEVISVFPNKGRKLHTTHSWDFLLLEKNGVVHQSSLWKKAKFGEDTIIGNLDTGVWPEAKSFSDEGLGPVPARWKGSCEEGFETHCNRKLIGARHFNKGYKAAGGEIESSINSARDYDGHGSHTLSTAGGSFVPGASINGIANGTAKGGSPKARVAAYKVCWKPINGSECYDSDILAAFDMAIHDGVDVLSVSLGGDPADYFQDGLAIGAFHAVQHGIAVICSAGNSGPSAGTVSNVAPWLFTVGASTLDRQFEAFVELRNRLRLKGTSLSEPLPENRLYPLISAAQAKAANASADDAMLCKPGTLDHDKVKGKILACLRGNTSRVDKGMQAKLAGAVGMILCNDEASGNEIIADMHVLPAAHLTYKDGAAVLAYINSTDPADGAYGFITIPEAALHTKPAPYMAAFSSRGPNTITPEILKPDITAPGVDIIAAYSKAVSPTAEPSDKRRVPFMVDSGTSMACPHISGIAGLLKTLHPDWSPAAIRSAIMTSARTRDNTENPMLDADYVKATPFSYGAGHVRPNRAADPGLIYDLKKTDYLHFLCAIGYNKTMVRAFKHGFHHCPKPDSPKANLLNFNYPSITVPRLSGSVTVTRHVTNVGQPGTYFAHVKQPKGVSVTVKPTAMKFEEVGQVKRFKVTLTSNAGMPEGYVFGGLTWSDGKHYVRSPIVVAAAAA